MLYIGGERGEKGDDAEQRVRAIIEDSGFRPVAAGRDLEDVRLLERLGILLHKVSVAECKGDLDIGLVVVKP